MKKILFLLISVFGLCLCLAGCAGGADTPEEEPGQAADKYANFGFMVEASVGEGQTIYTPGAYGYRYGPAFIYNGDNVLEGWFSGQPAYTGVWDVLYYQQSLDYGKTWSTEVYGCEPISGSQEQYSCCDPGVLRFNGYYYALYTSTIEPAGRYNNVYGARSVSPTGPWEKWNGADWGGNDPQPIIEYASDVSFYGIGEPSMVVVDDTIYVYYTYKGRLGNGASVNQTRVMTGDRTDANWPATLKERGVALGNKDSQEDSMDVKYIPEYKLWLGVTTCKRISTQSYIQLYQSFDGLTFYKIYSMDDSLAKKRLHNIGMTGDELGHIDLSIPQYVSYAYAKAGLEWGVWSTDINQLFLTVTEIKNLNEIIGDTVSVETGFPGGAAPAVWAMTESSETRTALKAIDKNTETFYSSVMHTAVTSSSNKYHSGRYYAESLAVKAPEGGAAGLKLTPREELYCFPSAFSLQSSADGIIWETVAGQSYSGYTVSNAGAIELRFGSRVTANYFRILATELTADQFGSYGLQIAEIALL